MSRMDDLIQAATSPFRADLDLQAEIARELRAHLEDAFEAARAKGMDEAQAEETAVRTFGDPEEVAAKLWRANLRRVRLRAILRWAAGLVLMPAAILAAIGALLWGREIVPVVSCLLGLAFALLLSRRFLPKNAFFGFAYLRWLPAAFCKSAAVAIRHAWIWALVLPVWIINLAMGMKLFRFFAEKQQGYHEVKSIFETHAMRHGDLGAFRVLIGLGPWLHFGPALLLFGIGYIVFAPRIGRRLQSASRLNELHGGRWRVAIIVGASASVLMWTYLFFPSWVFRHQMLEIQRLLIPFDNFIFTLLMILAVPFGALLEALYLTIVLRCLRRQPLAPDAVLKSAFGSVGPLMWLGIILIPWTVPQHGVIFQGDWMLSPAGKFVWSWGWRLYFAVLLLTAFVPVIIVTQHCSFRRACARLGFFIWEHFWRYVVFVFLGASLLAMPGWAVNAAFGQYSLTAAVYDVIQIPLVLNIVLTIMCFEFCLTKAGTAAPVSAGAAAPTGSRTNAD